MFLAVIMVCSFFAEDDCKFFDDTLGLHMTEESCIERVHEMVESLKGVHRHFEDEIYVLPDSKNRFFYKCDDETGIQVWTTAGELHAYVQQNVIQQSSGSQTPELQGDADRVLVRFQ